MKKLLLGIVLCSSLILVLTGCGSKNNGKENDSADDKFFSGTTLDDGRIIHTSFDVPYKDDELGLGNALLNNKITIDEFFESLELIDTLKDGGSKLYKYHKINKNFGDNDFYVLACNSFDDKKSIFITKYKESLNGRCETKIDDIKDIKMTIKEGTITNKSATIVITDTTGEDYTYGEYYRIDKLENGVWQNLNIIYEGNYGWISIGYKVGDNHKLEMNLNWESLYGALESGTYRIVKSTSLPGEVPEHYITAEFTI